MKKIIILVSFALVMSGSAGSIWATSYTGSLTTPLASGIIAASEWANGVSLSWLVDDTTNPGFWTYKYTWDDTSGQQKNLSHIIIELSPGATNIQVAYPIGYSGSSVIGTYKPSDPGDSNPNLPGEIYGIKVTRSSDTDPFVFSLITDRAPVWGDFYAKDGVTNPTGVNTAWNEGFLREDPTNAPAPGSIDNHILRPDTFGVPEPGTLMLLGAGLLGLWAVRRRK